MENVPNVTRRYTGYGNKSEKIFIIYSGRGSCQIWHKKTILGSADLCNTVITQKKIAKKQKQFRPFSNEILSMGRLKFNIMML